VRKIRMAVCRIKKEGSGNRMKLICKVKEAVNQLVRNAKRRRITTEQENLGEKDESMRIEHGGHGGVIVFYGQILRKSTGP